MSSSWANTYVRGIIGMPSPCRISSVLISSTDVTWRELWHDHSSHACSWHHSDNMPLMSHTSSIHPTDGCLHVKNLHITETTDCCLVAIYRSEDKNEAEGKGVCQWYITCQAFRVVFMSVLDRYLLIVAFMSKIYSRFYRIGGLDTFVFLLAFRLPNVIGFWHCDTIMRQTVPFIRLQKSHHQICPSNPFAYGSWST
jgi:hypothetical protein